MFKPLGTRVLVKKEETESKTVAGIIIPDSVDKPIIRATVVAIGKGITTKDGKIPLTVKIGDLVAFNKYSGQEIKLKGEKYLILKEEELLGVVSHG